MIAYIDGRWLPATAAAVPLADRGFLLGHAVFETVRVYGDRLFRLEAHTERLLTGARSIGLERDGAAAEIAAAATELIARNASPDATLRIMLTGGDQHATRLLLIQTPMPADWRERTARGWHVITADIRHPPPSTVPAHIKSPGRISGLLARLQAQRAGADDALLLDQQGRVAEGPSWNIFWRVGRRLYTPSAELGVLEGVTRATLLELADELGWPVEQGAFGRETLDTADEVFATLTSVGPVAFATLDGRRLPDVARNAVSALSAAYWQRVDRDAH
ncbi:MAG: aminotransferase class IV [Longimicrobiales bacterium]